MKAIIIGGGIAGLATAIGLHNKNHEVEVYESAPAFKPVGAGILLATNGIEALRRLNKDLVSEVKQRSNQIDRMQVHNQKGKPLASSQFASHQLSFAIHRAELIDALRKFVPEQSLFTGKSFKQHTDFQPTDTQPKNIQTRLKVTFQNETETKGDFLVGTDGIGSQVRTQLLGELPYRYSGQTCWRAIVPYKLPKNYQNTFVEVWGKERGLRVGYGAINQEQVYYFATYFTKAGGQDDPNQVKSRLQDIYKDFPPLVVDLINQTKPEAILRNDIYDLTPFSQWHQGNVVLAGDAAHATTPNMGQGGNQALESAWVLSECIGRQPDLSKAFAQYQQMRIKKAHRIINDSWRISQLVNLKGSMMRGLRNVALQLTPSRVTEANLRKVYALDYEF